MVEEARARRCSGSAPCRGPPVVRHCQGSPAVSSVLVYCTETPGVCRASHCHVSTVAEEAAAQYSTWGLKLN